MNEKSVIELDDAHWEETVERSKLPVAIMFYNPLCSHYIAMMAALRQVCGRVQASQKDR
ncbi:MAG: hypothetical protein ACE14P_01450 [Methanotrichaceae archaeon]